MEIMQRMNKRMDIGWKLTNSNCQKCTGITMIDPNNPIEYYCPKCDKLTDYSFDIEIQKQSKNNNSDNNQEDYFSQVIAQSGLFNKPAPIQKPSETHIRHNQNYAIGSLQKKQKNTNNVSKKMGEKLLQGWAMLEQSCQQCNVPLMKSKKGEKICCSCERDYAKQQADKQKKSTTTVPNPNAQQWKKSQAQQALQTKPIQQQNNAILNAINSTQILNNTIQNTAQKTHELIENFKLDKAIDENDISAVEKILTIVKTLKQ